MNANQKKHKNFYEFAKQDKSFEEKSKKLLAEIDIKSNEKKLNSNSKNTLLKIINFLLSLEFFQSIASKIPNPRDFKSKDEFVKKSMTIIEKEFKEKVNK